MSNIERFEGRRFAIQMLESVNGMPKAFFDQKGGIETVIDNLEAAAKVRPESYAVGIREVLREVRA